MSVQVALNGAGQLLTEYERLADLVKSRSKRLEEDRGEFRLLLRLLGPMIMDFCPS
jgi:hypothetical protein